MLVAVEQYGAEHRSAARRLAGWASLLRWAEQAAQIRPQVSPLFRGAMYGLLS